MESAGSVNTVQKHTNHYRHAQYDHRQWLVLCCEYSDRLAFCLYTQATVKGGDGRVFPGVKGEWVFHVVPIGHSPYAVILCPPDNKNGFGGITALTAFARREIAMAMCELDSQLVKKVAQLAYPEFDFYNGSIICRGPWITLLTTFPHVS